MSAAVKDGPSYRQQQAMATKDRIADAAQGLFARQGYGSTSMEAVAREAGVAARTVYGAFGAKREILSAICERWLERAEARSVAEEVMALPTARDRIRGAAAWLARLYSTDFDVVEILDAATDEDEETRALLRSKLRGRNRTMDAMLATAADDLVIPLNDAQALFRAYAATGVYRELVKQSGWTVRRFEDWVADALELQLLAPRA